MGIFEYLCGSVRIEVTCHSAERFLNICTGMDIKFRNTKKINSDIVEMTVRPEEYRRIAANAGRHGYEVRLLSEKGAVFIARKLKKRYVLIGGMIICAALIWVSSLFVWEIDVSGNEKITEAEILAELANLGVGVGTCRFNISQEYISNEMLQRIKELSFIAVNVSGSHAEVIVREERKTPEIVDEITAKLVYAEKSGIITKMTVLEGTPIAKVGVTVNAGEILVSGIAESVSSGKRIVSASAEIFARTWYEKTAKMPELSCEKIYTGKEHNRLAFILCGKRINLYFNGGNTDVSCDKIITSESIRIKDMLLPVKVIKENLREYELSYSNEDIGTAEETLQKGLIERLKKEIGKDGEIVKSEFETVVKDGAIIVTLKAECIERIDKQRELTENEKIAAGKEENNGGEDNQR